MRYVAGACIAITLALVQASSIEQFRVFGVAPNLMLVFLVSWLVVRGLDDVLPMLAVAGVTLGLIGLQTPGLVLLALLPIAALGALREMHIVHSEILLTLLLVGAATVAYETIVLASVMVTGGALDPAAGIRSAILPATLVNLLLTPLVFVVMRFARAPARRNRFSYELKD